jgi:hypothetical protein
MTMTKKAAFLALGAILSVGPIVGSAGAQDKCAGSKEKATGKLAGSVLKCDARAASSGQPVSPSCIPTADGKLETAFTRAESRPPCDTTGDAGTIETKTHNFAADLDGELYSGSGVDKCAGSKIGAAGKKASGLLGCQAKAAAKGIGVDSACIAKVTGKFSAAFSKAESRGGCHTSGDVGTIEPKVDNYVADIVNTLQPPMTTTTSPTTTTSTTSPAVQCCRPTSAGGAFLNCDVESAAACANGGMDAGPGTCSPNPCTGSTFTSTTATSTSTTTTSTTTSTTSTTICGCCPSASSLFRFTNSTGTGNCGTVKDASGTLLFNLACGGLYTGAGASTLTQPASPPDMSTNYTRTTGCSGTAFNLVATLPTDLAAVAPTNPHRFCTSAGVADPDYPACAGGANVGKPCVTNSDCPSSTCTSTMPGCLFGAPLAIPNPTFTGASVCVVNRVSTSATGSGNCATGATNLSLPLASDLYLTGDLLDGSAPDRPNVPGIQPCPICNPSTNLCEGGPRNGLACHPDTSALNAAYPTSHDCPPPPGALGANYIGALPVPFNLTTDPSGTSAPEHLVANNTNASGQEVFCGFCGAQFSPTFHNPPIACANDAACASVTGCPGTVACNRCKQRDSGAFGSSVSPAPGSEHEITLFGSSAGVCLHDGLPHASTLVSAFCIPPSFNATVDANGDLPGPGAVSLPGQATLIP